MTRSRRKRSLRRKYKIRGGEGAGIHYAYLRLVVLLSMILYLWTLLFAWHSTQKACCPSMTSSKYCHTRDLGLAGFTLMGSVGGRILLPWLVVIDR